MLMGYRPVIARETVATCWVQCPDSQILQHRMSITQAAMRTTEDAISWTTWQILTQTTEKGVHHSAPLTAWSIA